MRLLFSLLLTLFMGSLTAETVYKTVDEEGNVIFTDKPFDKSEKIEIDKLETIKNPNPARYTATPKQPEKSSNNYESFNVTSPKDNAGIRSNSGNVSISLSLKPALQVGHKIIILMDGKEVGIGSSVSLQNVARGTHGVSARVIDANGKSLISTSSSFSLLRASQ